MKWLLENLIHRLLNNANIITDDPWHLGHIRLQEMQAAGYIYTEVDWPLFLALKATGQIQERLHLSDGTIYWEINYEEHKRRQAASLIQNGS